MLDSGWAAVIAGVEIAVVGAAASAVLSEARGEEERDARLVEATAAARARRVAPAVQDLIRVVEASRRREQATLDGTIPAESFEDAMARMPLKTEFDQILSAVEVARAPRAAQERSLRYSRVTAVTLAMFAALLPFALWAPLTGSSLGPNPWPTVCEVATGGAGALALAAFALWIGAIRSLATAMRVARGEE